MKTGVLGGTFDPVHLGHIRMAEEAADALGLERVIMVPAGRPMSKTDRPVTAAAHRVEMLRLAVKRRPRLEVSTVEIERPGPSYTIDTIRELKRKYGPGTGIYFILGWDSLEQLPSWHDPAGLAAECRLAAVPRPGFPRPDVKELEKEVPGISRSVIFLERPEIDISATDIRDRAARGEPLGGLVPPAVEDYIKKHKLYTEAGGTA